MFLRVLILIFMMLVIPFTANAADSANSFSVEVLPAEGQRSFSEGYFHLDSEPGKTLALDFRVTNNSNEPVRLKLQAVDAYTADEGGILYSAQATADDKETIGMAELINIEESITVAAGGTENVHFHVAIPETANGTILGGIMLTDDGAPENLTMDRMNKGASNYSFEQPGQRLVAVKLNLPKKGASSGFSMEDAKFDPSLKRVSIEVKNGDAAVIKNVQGTYTVMDKEGEVMLSGVVEPFAMAPLSEIDFPVDLKGILFEKGKYVLMIKGRADEKEFFVEEKFTVNETQESGFISQSTGDEPTASWAQISRTVAIVLAALLLLLPIIIKLTLRNEKRDTMKFSEKL